MTLKDLKVGDKVWCGCYSGFCHDSFEPVKEIKIKYDETTGKPYNIIRTLTGTYDSRDGSAITGPRAYFIEIINLTDESDTKYFRTLL